jgi:hypothetical protein
MRHHLWHLKAGVGSDLIFILYNLLFLYLILYNSFILYLIIFNY